MTTTDQCVLEGEKEKVRKKEDSEEYDIIRKILDGRDNNGSLIVLRGLLWTKMSKYLILIEKQFSEN